MAEFGYFSSERTTSTNDDFGRLIYYNFTYAESITPPFEFCGEPGGRNYVRGNSIYASRIDKDRPPVFGGDDYEVYPNVTWTIEDLDVAWNTGQATVSGGGTSGSYVIDAQRFAGKTITYPNLTVIDYVETFFSPGLTNLDQKASYYYHSDQIGQHIIPPPDIELTATLDNDGEITEQRRSYTFNRVVFQKISSPFSSANFNEVWCLDSIETAGQSGTWRQQIWFEYRRK